MRILIAEDDLASRIFMSKLLARYGECDTVVDGFEVLDAFLLALKERKPYDLLCLDIMMPKLDGLKALRAIREIERQNEFLTTPHKTKVIITTALNDRKTILSAQEADCAAFAWKPIDVEKFFQVMEHLGLTAAH
ncbi:MAG: response regulator [Sporomusaceae bacterium]|nr:response regulator [Sporomusaceae bacterium]